MTTGPRREANGISRRRALAAGAAVSATAWAAPQILSAPAASAASLLCSAYDWDPETTGSTFSSLTVNGVTLTDTITALPATTLLATNNTIRASPNGGIAEKALQFQMEPDGTGIGQDITLDFDAPVQNVSFTVTDIDNVIGGWFDQLEVVSPAFTFSFPGGSTVTGSGTAGDLFRNTQGDNNFPDTSDEGNLVLTFAGPLTSIHLQYTNGGLTGGGNQRIAISDIAFCI